MILEYASFFQPVILNRENRIKEIEKTATTYNTKTEFFTDMAHDMMLEPQWQDVADQIAAGLGEQDLPNK